MCIYVCMVFMCMCVHLHTYVCGHTCGHICSDVCMSTCVQYMCACAFMCTCMSMYVSTCMHLCEYAFACVHVWFSCLCPHVCLCVGTHTHVLCACASTCVHLCVVMHICVHMCVVFICVSTCVHVCVRLCSGQSRGREGESRKSRIVLDYTTCLSITCTYFIVAWCYAPRISKLQRLTSYKLTYNISLHLLLNT